jgi:hypothetical protein
MGKKAAAEEQGVVAPVLVERWAHDFKLASGLRLDSGCTL